MRRALLLLAAALLVAGRPVFGQGREAAPRTRTTTIAALTAYPLFFNRQRARVQGEVVVESGGGVVYLSDGARRTVLADTGTRTPGAGARIEVTGAFWDVGRLQADDPRLPAIDFQLLSRSVLNRDWPNPGELLVVLVESTAPFEETADPTLRAIAIDPARFEGKRVTVAGRFRGANLYGDLPGVPGKSKWDFVLQAADAAVWVTNLRPRGKSFDLSPQARVDTGRWVRVSGVVRYEDALVWIEGQEIEATDAQPEADTPPAAEPAYRTTVVTPPAVIFSAPVQDDTDVPVNTDVRIQFSRDMDAESFKDRVKIAYFGGAPEAPQPPAFTFAYRQGTRVLEIHFGAPLERFRTVRVELLDGITAIDGAPLQAWTLTFSVGGR